LAGGWRPLAVPLTRLEQLRRPAGRRPERLTEREREVVTAIARGSNNAEIGEELFIGAATVKSHVSSILTKLGLRDRAQIVVFAYESGVVQAGDVDIGY
jgi:DNA-binding NarL/FixJ family response regulator